MHTFGGSMMRGYLPWGEPGRILHSAQNVKIFPDEITEGMRRMVAASLEWAERVIFLGFSFHPSNVRKLLAGPNLLAGKDVRGTVLGMDDDAIERTQALIGRDFQALPRNLTVFDAVQGCEWFREE